MVEAPAKKGLPGRRSVVVGIGDDAAVWRPSRSHLSVVTTDALVDGVHFLSGAMDATEIGHRAMAANLSDIAAMGARPVLATVALGVAADTNESWILACYRGMAALAGSFGTAIVGGDIVRAPAITLALTVIGEVSPSRLKRREGGLPGDIVALTGPLGASRAGLELVRRPDLVVEDEARTTALAAFATPQPRVREGRWLAASVHVRAMMDVSDGLSTDLGRLARASSCGATLEEIPLHPAAASVARVAGAEPESFALDGGEDFELIIAVAPRAYAHLARRYATHFGKPLVRAGRLDAMPGLRRSALDGDRDVVAAGYDHFETSRA